MHEITIAVAKMICNNFFIIFHSFLNFLAKMRKRGYYRLFISLFTLQYVNSPFPEVIIA